MKLILWMTILVQVVTMVQAQDIQALLAIAENSPCDSTKLVQCAMPLFAHLDEFVNCQWNCSALSTATACLAEPPVRAGCLESVPGIVDTLLQSSGGNCTFVHAAEACPEAARILEPQTTPIPTTTTTATTSNSMRPAGKDAAILVLFLYVCQVVIRLRFNRQ